jgi:hypothetical protein
MREREEREREKREREKRKREKRERREREERERGRVGERGIDVWRTRAAVRELRERVKREIDR